MAQHSTTMPGFLPAQHLAFEKAPDFLTMKDIGFADSMGISPVAVTDPCKSLQGMKYIRNKY